MFSFQRFVVLSNTALVGNSKTFSSVLRLVTGTDAVGCGFVGNGASVCGVVVAGVETGAGLVNSVGSGEGVEAREESEVESEADVAGLVGVAMA